MRLVEGIFFNCTGGLMVVSNFFSSVRGSFCNCMREEVMSNFLVLVGIAYCVLLLVVGSFFNCVRGFNSVWGLVVGKTLPCLNVM